MNLIAYALYDSVAETFTHPMFMHNDNEAKRAFRNWCNNVELPMSEHPEDYALFAIGFYDMSTGILEPQTPVTQIMRGSSSEPAPLKAVENQ